MAKRMTKRLIAYCGKRRYSSGKMLDAYVLMDGPMEDLLFYTASRRARFVIGQIYEGKVSVDHTTDFSSFEATADIIESSLLAKWSAEDAVARRTHQNESARKKLQKEHRQSWKEVLEPLRGQYRRMSLSQRRAMQQLIVEWLNE